MNKKWMPYILFGVPVLIAILLIKKASAQGKGEFGLPSEGGDETGGGDGGTKTSTKNDNFPLKKGSRGDRVKELQKAINDNSSAKLTTDGDFGSKTETALFKLTGKKTVDSQAELDAIKKVKTTQATDSDRRALAQMLFAKWNQNKSQVWTAIHDVAVSVSDVTTDGRAYNTKNVVFKQGEYIPKDTNASGTYNNKGIVIWNSMGKRYMFSPYGFQVALVGASFLFESAGGLGGVAQKSDNLIFPTYFGNVVLGLKM